MTRQVLIDDDDSSIRMRTEPLLTSQFRCSHLDRASRVGISHRISVFSGFPTSIKLSWEQAHIGGEKGDPCFRLKTECSSRFLVGTENHGFLCLHSLEEGRLVALGFALGHGTECDCIADDIKELPWMSFLSLDDW